mgnify:CR=1 FL=1
MYRIYGKLKTGKRFKAFDYKNGIFVENLIYASFFYENELERLKKEVKYMNENNEDFISNKTRLRATLTRYSEPVNFRTDGTNDIEDWDFYINKQNDSKIDSTWMSLVRRDKDGNNIDQLDFDDITKEDLGKFIQSLRAIYKLL